MRHNPLNYPPSPEYIYLNISFWNVSYCWGCCKQILKVFSLSSPTNEIYWRGKSECRSISCVRKKKKLYSTQALQYTNQMLGSSHSEKGQSVPSVTNGVSLIYRSVWSNICRKHSLTETRAALTQLELPAVAASQAERCLDQSRWNAET